VILSSATSRLVIHLNLYGLPAALAAAGACFVIRMFGVHFGLTAPGPPGIDHDPGSTDSDPPAAGPADRR
jgi:hypothetical protein